MKKFIVALAAVAAVLAGCSSGDQFKVKVPVPADLKGSEVSIINPQTGDTLGTAVVQDTLVTISGSVAEPQMGIIVSNGMPMNQLIVEPGTITFNAQNMAVGTRQNDAFADYAGKFTEIADRQQNSASEQDAEKVLREEILPLTVNFIKQNPNNLYNPQVFGGSAPMMDLQQLRECIDADTLIASNPQARHYLLAAENKAKTSKGNAFPADVQVLQADSTMVKLSDYVKPGKYTVVDFWASWCGPCRAEVPNLINLYKEYHASKGLEVVGVAVWDKVDDTAKAVKELGINYPVIYNGNRDLTDLFGIIYIPTIIVVGPDGNIIARDVTGSELSTLIADTLK